MIREPNKLREPYDRAAEQAADHRNLRPSQAKRGAGGHKPTRLGALKGSATRRAKRMKVTLAGRSQC
jgi:hypothetical protein